MVNLELACVGHFATRTPKEPDAATVLNVVQDGFVSVGHLLIALLTFAHIEKKVALSSVFIAVTLTARTLRENNDIR